MGEIRVPMGSRDERIIWDPNKKEEVKSAQDQFDRMINEGYFAFSVKNGGEKMLAILEFDPDAEVIILGPPMVGG